MAIWEPIKIQHSDICLLSWERTTVSYEMSDMYGYVSMPYFPKGAVELSEVSNFRKKGSSKICRIHGANSLKTRKWTWAIGKVWTAWRFGENLMCFSREISRYAQCGWIWNHRVNFHILVCEFKELPGASWCRDLSNQDLTGAHSEHLRNRIFFREKTHPPMPNVKRLLLMVKAKDPRKKGYPLKSFAFVCICIFCSDPQIS